MMMNNRRKIAAGNWKMNTDLGSAIALAGELAAGFSSGDTGVEMILAVPFPFLHAVHSVISQNPSIHLAAQNLHQAEKGAYTGEVSGSMLKSVGCSHVLIGHSERRQYFSEGNALLLSKTQAALANGLTPVFCIGETLEQREANETFDVIKQQLQEGVLGLDSNSFRQLILAYEPVWAIGTGKTATPEQAQEVHAFIRKCVFDQYGSEMARLCPILYGGSVTAANAYLLFACPDIDGGLVGGASLKAGEFLEIANSFL